MALQMLIKRNQLKKLCAVGIEFMEQILIKEPSISQVALFDADLSRMFDATDGIRNSTRFESFKEEIASQQTETDLTSLGPKIIMESDQAKKQTMVEEFVTELIGSWLGTPASEVDMNTSMYSHGLDSFFALSFKMQVDATLHVSFEVGC